MDRVRVMGAALILVLILSGCSRAAEPQESQPEPHAGAPAVPATGVAGGEAEPPGARPGPAAQPESAEAPAVPPGPAVTAEGEEVVVTGLDRPSPQAWSPSGRRVLIASGPFTYLLDLAKPSLEVLSDFDPSFERPVFWSETQVFWMDAHGRALLRNLETGEDRLIHDFGGPVIHYIQPGDTQYIANREKGVVMQGYRFGTIVAGELGGAEERVLIETGHLIGRMASGQVLAVEGMRGGPLWALSPTGEKRLLSQDDAYFVQISPDGRRALWFTHSPEPAAEQARRQPLALLKDLLRPRVAYADPPYDPPLTDLWTWDGTGDPVRIPLGGTYSARARFSPDGQRIALALNEEIWTELAPGEERQPRPGHVAVVEGEEIRVLATFEGRVGIGMWLGEDGFRFTPPMEKTGAQLPVLRMDLSGQQSEIGGLWYHAGLHPDPDRGPSMLVIWSGDASTVYWSDSARVAQVHFDVNRHGQPLYAPPWAPYLPTGDSDALRFLRFASENTL